MASKRLERFNRENPHLAPLIERLLDYIKWQKERNVHELIPRVVAAKLGISEADVLGLLTVLEDAGLVRHRYDLVCAQNSAVLASFRSLDEIPENIECRYCGTEHGPEDLRVELVFEILRERSADAAA